MERLCKLHYSPSRVHAWSPTTYKRDSCTPLLIAALFTIAKLLKKTWCPRTNGWVKSGEYIYIHIYSHIYIYIYMRVLFSHKEE
jgi:hypothetical protein